MKKKTLAKANPELAKQWHSTKNENLSPKHVSCVSNQRVWWQCRNGHVWETTVRKRNKHPDCPWCEIEKILEKESLALKNPELAKEWHPTKNRPLTPKMVAAFSDKEVWWKCPKKHVWQERINERQFLAGCPCCAEEENRPRQNWLAAEKPILYKLLCGEE